MIICFTKDISLQNRLVNLLGDKITFRERPVQSASSEDTQTLYIYDLKFYRIPKEIKKHSVNIGLSNLPSVEEAVQLLGRNMKGYGNRHMHDENILQMIRTVQEDQLWLPPAVLSGIIGSLTAPSTIERSKKETILKQLSKREQEVAMLVAEGKGNNDIAEKMFISLRTVKAHLTSIYKKTGLKNRLELGLELKK